MPRRIARDPRREARRRGAGPKEPRSIEQIREGLLRNLGTQGRFMAKETRNDQKRYRCPWCEGWIAAAAVHVVAYQQGDAETRRHYHSGCWRKVPKS